MGTVGGYANDFSYVKDKESYARSAESARKLSKPHTPQQQQEPESPTLLPSEDGRSTHRQVSPHRNTRQEDLEMKQQRFIQNKGHMDQLPRREMQVHNNASMKAYAPRMLNKQYRSR